MRPTKPRQYSEAQIEAALRRHVRVMGGICEKLLPSRVGLPDRLVILPGGRVYLIELKAPSGSLSPAQRVFRDRCAAIGTEVVVIDSVNALATWVATCWAQMEDNHRKNLIKSYRQDANGTDYLPPEDQMITDSPDTMDDETAERILSRAIKFSSPSHPDIL